jgi:trehalose 6-phosphate phosphatase
MKPQSLKTALPSLKERILKADQLLLFLDYDGTLSPITEHPDKALLPAATRHVLDTLVREAGVWIALISGRGLNDLKSKVDLRGICYVGNHGLELQGPKLRYINPVAEKCRPQLRKIVQKLRAVLAPVKGAWVENKGLTLSVHYRMVAQDEEMLVRSAFHDCVRPYREKRQIRITSGKQVFEVRPPVRWTKGTIVNWLIGRRKAVAEGAGIVSVYIGDDLTDEDAFAALGSRGITIVVGSSNPLTRAQYQVESPAEVKEFLQWVLSVWRGRKAQEGSQKGA